MCGCTRDLAQHTYTLPFNDPQALREMFETKGDQIACVILDGNWEYGRFDLPRISRRSATPAPVL